MPKIRVLVIFANPRNTSSLRLGAEDRAIQQAVRRSRYRDNIELTRCHAATVHDLRQALLDDEFQMAHISGHGINQGLVLEDERGNEHIVPQKALAGLFKVYSPPLQCIILNACYSLTQGRLISLGVPFTIAMEGPIDDEAAIEFSRGFYDAIGAGRSIDFAYGEGCRTVALTLPNTQFLSKMLRQRTKHSRNVGSQPVVATSMTSGEPSLSSQADLSPSPRKKQALLDRRLTTEIVALLAQLGETRNIFTRNILRVDTRVPRLLEFGLGLFEQLIVENVYGSALGYYVNTEKVLEQAITFYQPQGEQQSEEFAMAVEDAGEAWARDPKFQLAISRYDRKKGSATGNIEANISYLQHTLLLAEQLDAAIIPHPDRWLLYNWWFENCIWGTGSEFPGIAISPLPQELTDPALKISQARLESLAQLTSRMPNTYKSTLGMVRYGPMPYPFPKGLLRRYDRTDLASFQRFLYEFCIPIDNASHLGGTQS